MSTRTIDRLPLSDGSIREIPGGPARYVGEALDRLGVPWRLMTRERALVDVIPGPGGEEYLIPALPTISLPPLLVAPAVILSPIIREVDAVALPRIDGLLAVDLQGFTRTPGRSSSDPGREYDLTALLERADVVKASPEEWERLTIESRQVGADTIVLLTEGARGARVRVGEQETFVPSTPVAAEHTIGAGDCYLAAFVVALIRGMDPIAAATEATVFTVEVLRERTRA